MNSLHFQCIIFFHFQFEIPINVRLYFAISYVEWHSNHIVFNQRWDLYLHLSDIDECKTGQLCGPNSHCHNMNGSFYCTCQRDYVLISGSKHFHPESGGRCEGRYVDAHTHTAHKDRHLFSLSLSVTKADSWTRTFPACFGKYIMQYIKLKCNLNCLMF